MAEHWFTASPDTYPGLIRQTDRFPINTLFARSVLTGDAEGVVYQNRETEPTAWYLVHAYGMSLLFGGTADAAFQAALAAHWQALRKDEWLQAYPDFWHGFLRGLAVKGFAHEYGRVNFTFDERVFRAHAKPSPYEISRTPVALLASLAGRVVPRDFWKPELLHKCVAYTVYVDGIPASTAFAAYIHGNVLEIGIETREAYRGKGLAELSSRALIDYCLENDCTPDWSCLDRNAGSLALARKLGFVPVPGHIPYYHFPASAE